MEKCATAGLSSSAVSKVSTAGAWQNGYEVMGRQLIPYFAIRHRVRNIHQRTFAHAGIHHN